MDDASGKRLQFKAAGQYNRLDRRFQEKVSLAGELCENYQEPSRQRVQEEQP